MRALEVKTKKQLVVMKRPARIKKKGLVNNLLWIHHSFLRALSISVVVVSFRLDHGEHVGWNSSRYDENTKSKGKNFYLLYFTVFFHCDCFYFWLHELLICNSILTQVGKGRKKEPNSCRYSSAKFWQRTGSE